MLQLDPRVLHEELGWDGNIMVIFQIIAVCQELHLTVSYWLLRTAWSPKYMPRSSLFNR